MAKYPQKTNVKLAIPANTFSHDLSHNHISTTDYFKIGVNFCAVAPTKNTIHFKNRSFVRLMPMTYPAFAEAKVHQRLYFVPFSRIQKSFNEMIERKPHAYSDFNPNTVPHGLQVPPGFRCCQMSDLVKVFTSNSIYAATTSATSYDFEDYSGGHYNFTPLGRYLYNLLIQLGIKIEFILDYSVTNLDYNVNIMNLLALARVYLDYYYTNEYETTKKQLVLKILDNNQLGLESISGVEVSYLLDFIATNIFYDKDYFTAAYDNPVGPNTLLSEQNLSVIDNTLPTFANNDKSRVVTSVNGHDTPILQRADGASQVLNLSQFIDSTLKRITQLVARKRLVGSRIVDRFLARFGVKLDDAELQRSAYIGDYSYKVMFGDVLSTADTSGAGLGDFAGKGIGYGETETMQFYNKEAGVYIGLFYVVPRIGYYQGIDRFSLCLTAYDFWTPEFDNLGTDAISQGEIYIPHKTLAGVNQNNVTKKIFGYSPRYSWLKKKLDLVSGDFMFDSINVGMDAWHLMRKIDPANYIGTGNILDIVHSLNFTNAYLDSTQYDRNFAVSKEKADNFIIVNTFECKMFNSMKPIYQTYEFDDLDSNKSVMMDVGGKHPNN